MGWKASSRQTSKKAETEKTQETPEKAEEEGDENQTPNMDSFSNLRYDLS